MKNVGEMSIGALAAFVSSHLAGHGIRVVLTGGACVSIYSDNKYLSYDLDFIEELSEGGRKLKAALAGIGFTKKGRHFTHPDTPFFLEFPAGPLSIGEERITRVAELQFLTGKLRLLSPTDCVKDRLAAFYHWDDQQSLEQAVLVARNRSIDMGNIREWSRGEGMLEKYDLFKKRLKGRGSEL